VIVFHRRFVLVDNAHTARHAVVHQHGSGASIEQQVLGPAADGLNDLPRQHSIERFRYWPPKPALAHFDADNSLVFQPRGNASATGLHFGQFRHIDDLV
jgi:hypothetical protein